LCQKSPGGYFFGMVRKAERGELRLDRTVWALRARLYGKTTHRTLN